jgi:hypothetical protein
MIHFVYIEADIWNPKKKSSRQKSDVKKSKKEKVYSSERMAYGIHFAPSASMF